VIVIYAIHAIIIDSTGLLEDEVIDMMSQITFILAISKKMHITCL